jgi:transketolase
MRQACLKSIFDLAKKNKKIIFIGSDLGSGVMKDFKKKYPERFFMEGVSEQSIVGTAAGLAMEGFLPYVNTIATFLTRRCFEQIIVDLCLHNLPVKLIGNGGGLVYAPLGPTHQAIEDISILRPIPNLAIVAPCDAVEMKKLILGTVNYKSPIYFRLARGGDPIVTSSKESVKFGKASIKIKPGKILIVSTGIMTQVALNAAKNINLKFKKNKCGVIHFGTIKPLDMICIKKWFPRVKKIITIEENILDGGFGSMILEIVNQYMPKISAKIIRLGLKNKFINFYGSQEELLNYYKLNEKNLVKKIMSL